MGITGTDVEGEWTRKGEAIFHEGGPRDALHLLEKGHVAIRVTTPRGDLATLLVNGPGSFFGELALLSDSARRNATVVALDPTDTLSRRRGQFEELRERHKAIERVLTAVLSAEVRRLSAGPAEAHFLPTEVGNSRRLIELEDVFGGQTTVALGATAT